jgi:Fur family transcriptional regulator, zinc uptake regulator
MKTDNAGAKELTKNQTLVLNTLSATDTPLSAYSILDHLRDQGLRAPLQVYRALDKLVEYGLVHRLESLNAFVSCSHPHRDIHSKMAFAICNRCDKVIEFDDKKIATHLETWANTDGFQLEQTTIELRGVCASCNTK